MPERGNTGLTRDRFAERLCRKSAMGHRQATIRIAGGGR